MQGSIFLPVAGGGGGRAKTVDDSNPSVQDFALGTTLMNGNRRHSILSLQIERRPGFIRNSHSSKSLDRDSLSEAAR